MLKHTLLHPQINQILARAGRAREEARKTDIAALVEAVHRHSRRLRHANGQNFTRLG